jgi:hypothetical protein
MGVQALLASQAKPDLQRKSLTFYDYQNNRPTQSLALCWIMVNPQAVITCFIQVYYCNDLIRRIKIFL